VRKALDYYHNLGPSIDPEGLRWLAVLQTSASLVRLVLEAIADALEAEAKAVEIDGFAEAG